MSVAGSIASQKAEHGVAHAVNCRALGVSESWFYKWRDRAPTPRQLRRARLEEAVRAVFDHRGRYGSPWVHAESRRPPRGLGSISSTTTRILRSTVMLVSLGSRHPESEGECGHG